MYGKIVISVLNVTSNIVLYIIPSYFSPTVWSISSIWDLLLLLLLLCQSQLSREKHLRLHRRASPAEPFLCNSCHWENTHLSIVSNSLILFRRVLARLFATLPANWRQAIEAKITTMLVTGEMVDRSLSIHQIEMLVFFFIEQVRGNHFLHDSTRPSHISSLGVLIFISYIATNKFQK